MRGLRNSAAAASRFVAPSATARATPELLRRQRVVATRRARRLSSVRHQLRAGTFAPWRRTEIIEGVHCFVEEWAGFGVTTISTQALPVRQQGPGPLERCQHSTMELDRGTKAAIGLGVDQSMAPREERRRQWTLPADATLVQLGHKLLRIRRPPNPDVALDQVRGPGHRYQQIDPLTGRERPGQLELCDRLRPVAFGQLQEAECSVGPELVRRQIRSTRHGESLVSVRTGFSEPAHGRLHPGDDRAGERG